MNVLVINYIKKEKAMIKKLLFYSFCLSLCLSPLAYGQHNQASENTIDENTLTEIVKQLPKEELASIEHIVSEKKDAKILMELGFLAMVAAGLYGLYEAHIYDGNPEKDFICFPEEIHSSSSDE